MSHESWTLLCSQAIQVALLAMIVWVSVHTFARNRPHLAHALWALVLLKCIMPPVWSSPAGIFSRIRLPIQMMREPAPQASILRLTNNVDSNGDDERDSLPALSASMRVEPLAPPERDNTGTLIPLSTSTETPTTEWVRLLLVVWVAGIIACLLTFGARLGIFWYRLRRMPHVPSPNIHAIATELATRLGIGRTIRVQVVDGDIGPAVVGLFRPTILLPWCIAKEQNAEQLRPLIAHELIHVRRGDLVWAMIQTISTCVWWFHPLVWKAAGKLTQEAEKSCDQETIVGLGCDPASYARGLLSVLEQKHRLKVAPALPGVRPVEVTKKRMERIMNVRQGCDRRTPAWIWILTLGAAVAVLPGASWVTAQEQSAPNKTVPPQDTAGAAQSSGPTPTQAQPNPTAAVAAPLANPPAPLNPSPAVTPPVDSQNRWSIRVYRVESILTRLTRSGLSREAAEKKLLETLPATKPDSLGRDARILRNNGEELQLGNDAPRRAFNGDQLIVFDSPTAHDSIAKLLQQYDRFGFDVVRVETTLALVPESKWNDVDISWQVVSGDAPKRSQDRLDDTDDTTPKKPTEALPAPPLPMRPDGDRVQHATPQPRTTTPTLGGNLGGNLNPEHNASNTTNARPIQVLQASATTVTREVTPLMIAILEKSEITQQLQGMKGIEILSRPQVMTQNGRTASVEVGRRRTMIVGYLGRKDREGKQRFEPVTREITEGTTMKLTPVLTDDRFVNLNLEVDVQTVRSPGRDPHPTSNFNDTRQPTPLLASMNVQTQVSVPLGATLAMGGLSIEQDGKPHRLLCLIQCHKLENGGNGLQDKSQTPSEQPSPNDSSAIEPAGTQATSGVPLRAASSTAAIAAGRENPSDSKLVMEVGKSPDLSSHSLPRLDLLDKQNMQVVIHGKL
ncbi:MAG: M56 family metallopeptidase, partial [Rubripirellula sp.]